LLLYPPAGRGRREEGKRDRAIPEGTSLLNKKIVNSQISGRKPKKTQPYHFVCTIDEVLQPQIASGAGSVEQKTIL